MYSFLFPPEFDRDFVVLKPKQAKDFTINLGQVGSSATLSAYSLHATASGAVKVEAFVTSGDVKDEKSWRASQSIETFILPAGENHFVQNAFTDCAQHFRLRVTSLDEEKEQAFAARLCFNEQITAFIKHRPKPEPDNFEVTQGSPLIIMKAKILENDYFEKPIKQILISDVVGGTLVETTDRFTFTPTARAGEDAGFSYHLVDVDDKKSIYACRVKVAINMLPSVTGYIFSAAELQTFLNNYVPPTFAEIFKSWTRFAASAYYPGGTAASGEAAAWAMMAGDQFRCTVNSNNLTGFVSPESFTQYEHQVDMSSTDTDDDNIYAIIAFKRIGSSNYSLMATRHLAGSWLPHTGGTGFGITLIVDGAATLIKAAPSNKCAASSGWNARSPTRVKVTRNGDIITVQASPFNSTNMDAGESISIDLKDYPSLEWAREKLPYGYACWSQLYSSFKNVKFSGAGALDADQVYSIETGDVYKFISGKWTATGTKIWDVLGYPRIIVNAVNKKSYLINKDSVTEIVE